MWSRPFTSRLVSAAISGDDEGRLLATHDGYARIGVQHYRGVAWSRGEWIVIWDFLTGRGTHRLDLHWVSVDLLALLGNRSRNTIVKRHLDGSSKVFERRRVQGAARASLEP